jgi:cysteine protease ATG4
MNTFKERAIRYFWDPEPQNDDPSKMIWCLGQQYTFATGSTDRSVDDSSSTRPNAWPTKFLDDFESRIWMTYRTGFSPIPRSPESKATHFASPAAALQFAGKLLRTQTNEGFTSDVGWGCMIRSAQSVLANALSLLHLGRGNPSRLAIFVNNRMAKESESVKSQVRGDTLVVCR